MSENEIVKAKVVVIDDDTVVLKAVTAVLENESYRVTPIQDAVEALATATDTSIDVVVLDITLPNISGMELLKAFKSAQPDVEVIMMTAHATVDTAVTAVKAGAYDYLTKPFENIDILSQTVARAAERKSLKDKTRRLEEALQVKSKFEDLIGQSGAMHRVFKMVDTVSHSSSTVLIQGESGTGKELVARAIHFRSQRKEQPFLAVNCSALTDSLLESELFGHVKGAFTGAVANKKGLFEAANGGTLFLDEIGDITPAMQVRLLRALQEGEVKKVGANETTRVNVRVIAASNVDLNRAKSEGRFREDLYYRLNVISIALPPLRDRHEDIPLLAHHFMRTFATRLQKSIRGMTPAAVSALTQARWSGNVRELENVMERAVLLCNGDTVDVSDLPTQMKRSQGGSDDSEVLSLSHLPYNEAKRLALRAFERRYLSAVLEKAGNNVSSAARSAGVDRSNFRRLLKQYEVAGRSRTEAQDDSSDG